MEKNELIAVQDLYPDNFSWCYGCGRLNDAGHHFRTVWKGEKTETIFEPTKDHLAVPGFVYGGVIASLIDCHGTGSAALASLRKSGVEPAKGVEPPRFVTGSLNVQFLKPTPHGIQLMAVGTPIEIHEKKWKIETEVFAGDLLCAKGEMVAVVMPNSFMK